MMHEILSKPSYERLPRQEQEFYELRIDDSDDIWRPGFILKQTRVSWCKSDQRFMWEEPDWERLPTIQQAQERYCIRLQALRAKGFTESDMGPF